MTSIVATRLFRKENSTARRLASERVRARLVEAGQRFNANENIAAFIRLAELNELRAEVEAGTQEVFNALVIDTASDHNTAETAHHVAKMFVDEVFRGRYQEAPLATSSPNGSQLKELMIVEPITMRSACSHHLCPIIGEVWVGVLPNATSDLIGLSKYARLCNWIMSHPQIQEEDIVMLADEFERRIRPDGLAVVMEADHFCMHWRCVKDEKLVMTISVMRGAPLADPNLRRDFFDLMRRKND